MQEQKGEERSVAKSKSTATNLSSHVPTCSSSAKSPIASNSPGILTASGKPESRMRGKSESDAASSSQARLKDAYLGGLMETATGKPVATKRNQGMWIFPILKLGVKKMWQENRLPVKQLKPFALSKSDCQGRPKAEKNRMVTLSTSVSSHNSSYGSSILDRQEDLRTRPRWPLWMIWTWTWLLGAYFWMPPLRAAVHFGQDYEVN